MRTNTAGAGRVGIKITSVAAVEGDLGEGVGGQAAEAPVEANQRVV